MKRDTDSRNPHPLTVARAQAGDRRALDAVLRLLQDPLFRYIAAIVEDDDSARDVLQDVLLIVARGISTLREPRWIRAWAFRIANREAIRAVRRSRRREAVHEEYGQHELPAAPGELEPQLSRRLEVLVASLSPSARTVVLLHYVEGLTLVEIAESLELPAGTVKSRLAYALASLRRMMEHETPAHIDSVCRA